VLKLADRAAEALTGLAVPASNPGWGEVQVHRARVLHDQGQFQECIDICDKVITDARAYDWSEHLPEALRAKARALRALSRLPEAEDLFAQAEEAFLDLRRFEQLGMAMHGRSLVLTRLGRISEARDVLLRALEFLETGQVGNPRAISACLHSLGTVDFTAGDLESAESWYSRALHRARLAGSRNGIAMALSGLADLDLMHGHVDRAESRYHSALRIFRSIGKSHTVVLRMNLGQVHLVRQHWVEAWEEFSEVLEIVDRQGRRGLSCVAHTMLMAACAGMGDDLGFDLHIESADQLFSETGFTDTDAAMVAELAGELYAAREHWHRALDAYSLAQKQWERLQRPSDVSRIQKRIALLNRST